MDINYKVLKVVFKPFFFFFFLQNIQNRYDFFEGQMGQEVENSAVRNINSNIYIKLKSKNKYETRKQKGNIGHLVGSYPCTSHI